ncbi:MAG: SDR family oxidoreductase [Acidobacteriota bacterium]|nr:SDR family oxidoreductase [Acidobacteriota bacterium]
MSRAEHRVTRASDTALRARFAGRLAVVTGGSSGIGLAVATRLVSVGARVVLVADQPLKLDAAATALGGLDADVHTVACDIGRPDEVTEAMARLLSRHGAPDLLVNNAGFAVYRTFEQSSMEEIERLFEVNFAGHLRCTKALLAPMIARRSGQIVNIASIAGLMTLTPNAVYGAAKFGIVGWSRSLRVELARFGIGVTCVCPGRVDTPFFDHETFRHRRHRKETELTVRMAVVVDATLDAAGRNRELVAVPRYFGWLSRAAAAVPPLQSLQHALLRRRVEDLYRD